MAYAAGWLFSILAIQVRLNRDMFHGGRDPQQMRPTFGRGVLLAVRPLLWSIRLYVFLHMSLFYPFKVMAYAAGCLWLVFKFVPYGTQNHK